MQQNAKTCYESLLSAIIGERNSDQYLGLRGVIYAQTSSQIRSSSYLRDRDIF